MPRVNAVCEQTNAYWKRIDSFDQKKLIHLSRSAICFAKPISVSYFIFDYCESHVCHRRTGRGAAALPPPPKITKLKSWANVQHKSGEELEIKKPKMPKSPQFVGRTKAVGQYSLHSRAILAYYKKNWDKLCQFCG
jgi:hypothetical protein